MRVLGIIAEYNPFHNGHLYHLKTSLHQTKADYTIAVMSGSFLQRGEPAVFSKTVRAKMAVEAGVDLVLELPTAYAVRSAPDFAFGGIKILSAAQVVDFLSFGSESGDLTALKKAAAITANEPPAVSRLIRQYLKEGSSYPKAQMLAWQKYDPPTAKILQTPNNILGIEYLKALEHLSSRIIPLTFSRFKSNYHDTVMQDDGFASASAIRECCFTDKNTAAILENLRPFVPKTALTEIKQALTDHTGPVRLEDFSSPLLALLQRTPASELSSYPDITEGLEKRLHRLAKAAENINAFLEQAKTKRYTRVRLQRILIYLMLNLTKEKLDLFNQAGGPQYLRVLAFSQRSAPLLKELRKKASLPVIQKITKDSKGLNSPAQQMLELDLLASDIYRLGQPKVSPGAADFQLPYRSKSR